MDYFNPQPKKFSQPKIENKFKKKKREPTGELVLFKQIYIKKKGKCEITHKPIEFEPSAFMHILSKGSFPKFRLNPQNIMLVDPEIHFLYDNSSMETLLDQYPEANIIYELKDLLKIEYFKPKPTI